MISSLMIDSMVLDILYGMLVVLLSLAFNFKCNTKCYHARVEAENSEYSC